MHFYSRTTKPCHQPHGLDARIDHAHHIDVWKCCIFAIGPRSPCHETYGLDRRVDHAHHIDIWNYCIFTVGPPNPCHQTCGLDTCAGHAHHVDDWNCCIWRKCILLQFLVWKWPRSSILDLRRERGFLAEPKQRHIDFSIFGFKKLLRFYGRTTKPMSPNLWSR